MQTLDRVSGSHNFLKFTQPPLVFRWEYVNMEKKVLYCLNSNQLQQSFPGISAQIEEKLFTSLQFQYDTENFFTVK